eukprot:s1781_g5.t2
MICFSKLQAQQFNHLDPQLTTRACHAVRTGVDSMAADDNNGPRSARCDLLDTCYALIRTSSMMNEEGSCKHCVGRGVPPVASEWTFLTVEHPLPSSSPEACLLGAKGFSPASDVAGLRSNSRCSRSLER